MGSDIGGILEKESIEFTDLAGRTIAIDAFNTIYQFLSIIRQPDGTPLMDSKHRVTSHLSGILYRMTNLTEAGIRPVFVFDGTPPPFKAKTIEARAAAKEEAKLKMKEAREKGIEDVKMWAQATSKMTEEILDGSKKLLGYMGIPVIQAPSEGEAEAAYLAKEGTVFAAGSQDYDALLFGAPHLVRNLTLSGRRKLPRKGIYISITPEIIELRKTLSTLGIDRQKLAWIAILVGTDYNEGVMGIGPKKGLAIAQKASSLKEAIAMAGAEYSSELGEIEEFYMKPPAKDVEIHFEEPKKDKIIDFLCGEHDFALERIEKAIERMSQKKEKAGKGQSSLGGWM